MTFPMPFIGGFTQTTTPLAISGVPVTSATEDNPYTGFSASASGGTAPYTFSVASGSLPAGITLNSSTGAVSGTPTTPGTSSGIVIRVTDNVGATADLASFSVVVAANTDPSFASVLLLCGFNGVDASTSFTDESSYARTLTTVGNAQVDTAQVKFGTGSGLFDGSGDRITAPDSADWQFSGQFTVEAFIRTTTIAAGVGAIASHYANTINQGWRLYRSGSAINAEFSTAASGTPAHVVNTASSVIAANTWHHICFERDGSDKMRVYVDGVMQASKTSATGTSNNTSDPFKIGEAQSGLTGWNGWIDEVRITKGVARYASDAGFVVPTAKYPRS